MEERLHKSASLLISAHHDEELLLLYGFSAKPLLASLCFQVLQDLHFFLAYNLVRQVTRIKLSFIQYMYVQRAVVLVMIARIPYFVANFFCRRASRLHSLILSVQSIKLQPPQYLDYQSSSATHYYHLRNIRTSGSHTCQLP